MPERVLREAAEWFATLQADDAGEPEHRRWRQWLSADAQHAQAWAYVEAMARRFDQLAPRLRQDPARQALARQFLKTKTNKKLSPNANW